MVVMCCVVLCGKHHLEHVAGTIDVDVKHCSTCVKRGNKKTAASRLATTLKRGSIAWELLVDSTAHCDPRLHTSDEFRSIS